MAAEMGIGWADISISPSIVVLAIFAIALIFPGRVSQIVKQITAAFYSGRKEGNGP